MPRSRTHSGLMAMALIAVAVAAAACSAGASVPRGASDLTLHGVSPDGHVIHRPDLAVLIGNAEAARDSGDWQNLRRFQSALVDEVGPAVVVAVRADYRRALADLAAANARGDARVRAEIRGQLRAMCDGHSVIGVFETCDSTSTMWGR
jgi:hypothetical protein